MTKDLFTGVHVSSAGQSSTLDEGGLTALPSTFISTDFLSKEHSDIPPPPAITGRDLYATSNIRPKRPSTTSLSHPVTESTNRYSILTVYDTNDLTLETNDSGCQSPSTKLTKRPASSSSRVNASNEKTTTTSSPILTTETTSGWLPRECEPSTTHARSDGAERALGVKTSDQAALLDSKVPPRGSSLTGCLEGIAVEGETSPGTERNARRLKFKSPRVEASTNEGAALPQSTTQGRRTAGCATADAAPSNVGAPNETKNQPSHPGGKIEDQTRTVRKRPETLEKSATQNPRAIGPEGRTVWSTSNATPDLGLDRRDDSTVVYPSPIDRTFDVLDSQKLKPGRACPDNPSGHHGAEERKEAASAQAVKRGPQVAMIEVPNKDDDTAYQQWLAKGSPVANPTRPVATLPTPPNSPIQIGRTYTDGQTYQDWQTQSKVTSPTVVAPSAANAKVREAPRQGWMKPLSACWTLQNVQEARSSNNAARAQLVLWMHPDRLGELTDELLEEL